MSPSDDTGGSPVQEVPGSEVLRGRDALAHLRPKEECEEAAGVAGAEAADAPFGRYSSGRARSPPGLSRALDDPGGPGHAGGPAPPAWTPQREQSTTAKAVLHCWSQQQLKESWRPEDLVFASERTGSGWVTTLTISGRHWSLGEQARACRSRARSTKKEAEHAAATVAIQQWQTVPVPGKERDDGGGSASSNRHAWR